MNLKSFFAIICVFFVSFISISATSAREKRSEDLDVHSADRLYMASGSGFFIDSKGFIATNYHVIDGAKGIDVFITFEGETLVYTAIPIAVDKINDLAIIKIKDSRFKPLSAIPYSLGSGTIDVGSSVFAMGYPELSYLGNEIKVTDGIISSNSGYQGDITTYQISAPIQPGNSGGPLFDKNGYVIGITNAGVSSLQNVGYAIKTSYLNNLIEACPQTIDLPKKNSLSGLSLPSLIKKICPYVVIIKVYDQDTSPSNVIEATITPKDGESLLLNGITLIQAGDTDKAVIALEAAFAAGKTEQAGRLLSNLFLKKGMELIKGGNYADAIDYCKKSNGYVENANAYKLLAASYTKIGKSRNAIEAYEKYLEMNPYANDAADVMFVIAATAQKSGDKATAIKYYKKLSSNSKYSAQASAQLGTL